MRTMLGTTRADERPTCSIASTVGGAHSPVRSQLNKSQAYFTTDD